MFLALIPSRLNRPARFLVDPGPQPRGPLPIYSTLIPRRTVPSFEAILPPPLQGGLTTDPELSV